MAKKKTVGLSIDEELHKLSVKVAKRNHSDFSKLVSMLLTEYHSRPHISLLNGSRGEAEEFNSIKARAELLGYSVSIDAKGIIYITSNLDCNMLNIRRDEYGMYYIENSTMYETGKLIGDKLAVYDMFTRR